MPLNKERLLAHLKASRGKSPASPAKPASIEQAEKLGQQAKKATGISKVEKEAEQATKASHSSALDVRQIAEQSLSPALLKRLLSGEKLTTEDQKQVAAVCKVAGYL